MLWATTLADIQSRYAGSVLGMFWLVIYPILMLTAYSVVYVFIFQVRLEQITTPQYVMLIFSGLIPFLGFSEGLGNSVISVTSNASLVKNTLYPIELIPVKAVLFSQCTEVVGLIVLTVAVAVTGLLSPWLLLALPLWVMTKMNSAMFNAMGDTKTPMYLQVLINVVNIALGYLLIFILKWDFYGAAIATAVSQIAGGGVGIILLNRKEYFRQAGKTGWGISDKESIKETLLKSIPVGLEDGMWQIYAIIMTKFLLTYGTNAYAGFQLATAAEEITELPVIGFTVAATTLAGRAKSQKSGPLFREYFKQQLWMNGTISALCTLAMICLPYGFMSIVTNDPALKEVGAVYLMIMGAILIPQNLQRTLTGTIYGGIGNTKATMIITVIGTWCIRIPMAALATYVFKWPLWTLWMFVGADQVARFLMMAFYVKRNKVLYCIENGTGEKKEDNN